MTSVSSVPPEVAENIMRLQAYVPGKPAEEVQRELGIASIVKLASNENPLGPSPKAQEAVKLLLSRMNIYPDGSAHELRTALAKSLDVDPACLVFGNGSDDIIHLLGVTFLEQGDTVLQSDPSFVRYEAAAILNQVECVEVTCTPSWECDLEAMLAKVDASTRLVFLANPNNPTGTAIKSADLQRFVEALPQRVILVLDEAYYEYARDFDWYPNAVKWVNEGRNVVILRTFSKAYGLAGLRVGYGIMRPEVAQWLERTREPFNVNMLAQAAAVAALNDTEFLELTINTNRQGLATIGDALVALGLEYVPSYGNFLFINVGFDGKAAAEMLLKMGVIVRYSPHFKGPTWIRVTVGTADENARFLESLKEVLAAVAKG